MIRLLSSLALCGLLLSAHAQKKSPASPTHAAAPEWTQFQALKFRNIGPARGGRSTAVAGIASQPHTFFMGATGGGVWRTDDGGNSWTNITDGFISVGSIGSMPMSFMWEPAPQIRAETCPSARGCINRPMAAKPGR
ncbi:MAG: hypothetical protein MUC38_12550 [Cyclobacteriaceae bacterium]|nr:hypothetical protein [Cyclobacteriaceae bacterium]